MRKRTIDFLCPNCKKLQDITHIIEGYEQRQLEKNNILIYKLWSCKELTKEEENICKEIEQSLTKKSEEER